MPRTLLIRLHDPTLDHIRVDQVVGREAVAAPVGGQDDRPVLRAALPATVTWWPLSPAFRPLCSPTYARSDEPRPCPTESEPELGLSLPKVRLPPTLDDRLRSWFVSWREATVRSRPTFRSTSGAV